MDEGFEPMRSSLGRGLYGSFFVDTIAHYSTYVHFHDETPTIPKVIYMGHVGTYPIMHHAFDPEQAHADNRLQSRCVVRGCRCIFRSCVAPE